MELEQFSIRRACAIGALVLIGLSAVGCTEALETGYKPTALKDSATVRKSYYAPAFTPEAKAPQLEREQEFEQRRPKPGY
jgi:hypothetical protein